MSGKVLAADIGGTHARFMLTEQTHLDGPPSAPQPKRLDLEVSDYPGIQELIQAALVHFAVSGTADLDAVLALAGPVRDARVKLTNLPWTVDAGALEAYFGFRRVILVNDLAAAARALAQRAPADATMLRRGNPEPYGRCLLVSVGTGLGTAYWSRIGGHLHIEPAEAGHAGFAASETWQVEWLQSLQRRYGDRISWERVVSGAGLAALDAFMRGGDLGPAANVPHRAVNGDSIAQSVLRRFAQLLGTFSGDLALAGPARGGVWLAGGVLAGLGPLFDTRVFMESFGAKGRLTSVLDEVPIHWVTNGELGLRGAWLTAHAPLQPERNDLWASP
jgi:glucokinase